MVSMTLGTRKKNSDLQRGMQDNTDLRFLFLENVFVREGSSNSVLPTQKDSPQMTQLFLLKIARSAGEV